jgi:hypothetical protein
LNFLLFAAVAIAMLLPGFHGVAAQAAASEKPAPRMAELGFPELRIIATDEGADVPREVVAGRYLVVLENRGTPDGPAVDSDVNFLQLPPSITLDDLNEAITAEGAAPPDWFFDIVSAGGFHVAAGNIGYAVLDLEPGDWYVGVGENQLGQANPYSLLTVTGNAPATQTSINDPQADITVELGDFTFDMPLEIPVGRQVWHVTNDDAQSHEVMLVRTPELVTVEQVQAVVALSEGGTLPEGVPDPATFEFPAAGLPTMSAGRAIWFETNLTPGNYVALCANLDSATGQPHALAGEVIIFAIGE